MIIIKKYSPDWPLAFANEKQALASALGNAIETIEHVGSTSVPELSSKPVIDILIGVKSLPLVSDNIITAMQSLGYSYIQEYENIMPERRFFKRKDIHIRFNVHLVESHSQFYHDLVLFKKILLSDPEILARYQDLKFKLSKEHDDEYHYANAKSEFIATVLRNVKENTSKG